MIQILILLLLPNICAICRQHLGNAAEFYRFLCIRLGIDHSALGFNSRESPVLRQVIAVRLRIVGTE